MTDEARKINDAAAEITGAISLTMGQMAPKLKAKFGIDGQSLNLAIAKAGIHTTAMATMAGPHRNIDDAKALGKELEKVVERALKDSSR